MLMSPKESKHIISPIERLQPAKFPEDEAMRAFRTIADMKATYDAVEQSPRDGSIIAGGEFNSYDEALVWAEQAPHRTARVRYSTDYIEI